jgi:2-haloacid dehalogenase
MDGGGSWADAEKEVAASHPHWAEHARAYRANFDASLTGALDDTVAVLRDLHAAGVPVFALTNWSHELFPHALARFGFLSLFEDIVVSGTEGVAKPDTAVFALLERRTGRPLSRCLFIDDKADNVTAAAEAGLDAVLFTGAVQLREDLRARGLPV